MYARSKERAVGVRRRLGTPYGVPRARWPCLRSKSWHNASALLILPGTIILVKIRATNGHRPLRKRKTTPQLRLARSTQTRGVRLSRKTDATSLRTSDDGLAAFPTVMPQEEQGRVRRLHRVRRQLTDGRTITHYYHRPTGERLPHPNDPAFKSAYEAAERRLAQMRSDGQAPIPPQLTLTQQSLPRQSERTSESECQAASIVPGVMEGAPPIRYLTPEELALRWREKVTIETLANWRAKAIGPPYNKIGKAVLYRADLLDKWERRSLVACDLPNSLIVTEGED